MDEPTTEPTPTEIAELLANATARPWKWRPAEDRIAASLAGPEVGDTVLDLGTDPKPSEWYGRTGQEPCDADARLLELAPVLAEGWLRLAAENERQQAEIARLQRTLAVERGDASQAPPGWAPWPLSDTWGSARARVFRSRHGSGWQPEIDTAKGVEVLPACGTALEAMEAADEASKENA